MVFVFKLCYLWCLFVDVVQRVVLCICVVVVCGPNFVFDGVCACLKVSPFVFVSGCGMREKSLLNVVGTWK